MSTGISKGGDFCLNISPRRFDQTIIFLHYLWCAPLQLAIVTGLLYQRIGPYALVVSLKLIQWLPMKNEIIQAAVLLVSAVPFQSWMGRQFAKLRVETATKTDKRIRLMNEIINGMKVIKMYTWEEPFAKLVHKARKVQNPELHHFAYGILAKW